MMNVLLLYNAKATFTNTVFEHIDSFARYSTNRILYCHQDQDQTFNADLSGFDAVILHYSIRLPFDEIAEKAAEALSRYSGLKVLFIQDEYDHTHRAWRWIKRLGIHLIFTVVPPESIPCIYPPDQFPGVSFVSNFTGYVPDDLPEYDALRPPSLRERMVGYRGRPLPIRYGRLGQEKVEIGRLVKRYCESNGIRHDIAWSEDDRIYGPRWYEFIMSCRAVLGTESGSNVFDWDGTLNSRVEVYLRSRRNPTEEEIYLSVIEPLEMDGIMNQVSPRIFEAIALRSVLILFEGRYSGVVIPERHYIPLKKDGTNLADVFSLLQDDCYVDEMTERAYREIIVSGKYSYRSFVRMVDERMQESLQRHGLQMQRRLSEDGFAYSGCGPSPVTSAPVRLFRFQDRNRSTRLAYKVWGALPGAVKAPLKPMLKQLFRERSFYT